MVLASFKKVSYVLVFMLLSTQAQSQDAVPGEFIVRYKNGVSSFNALGKTSSRHNFKLEKSWSKINTYSFKTNSQNRSKEDQQKTLDELRANPDVLYAEPNYYVRAQYSPLTGADVEAPASWSASFSGVGPAVTVAVLDSGLDINHEIFNGTGRLWDNTAELTGTTGVDDDGNGYVDDYHGWNFLNDNNNLSDGSGHGTHVAGIVVGATENISDVSTTADPPRVKVMVLKFLDSEGVGTTSDAINAIYYAVDNGAKVLNNSWGGSGYSGSLHEAIAYSFFQNTLFVAAAGNTGGNNDASPIFPASYDVPNVLSVSATNDSDELAFFSNFGAETVDVAAPGVSIFSAAPGGGLVLSSGTSMSTPFTAGLAALMINEVPHFTGYQLKRDMMESADSVSVLSGSSKTGGRVNFNSAVSLVQSKSSEASFLPDYTPDYNYSSRDLASLADGEDGGFGCGRVSEAYKKQNSKFNKSTLSFKNIFLMTLFFMPLFAVFRMRNKVKNQRRYERYAVDFKGFVTTEEGDRLEVEVFSFSVGGAGIRLLSSTGDHVSRGKSLKLSVNLPSGKETYSCKAVSEFNDSVGLCFDNT